MTIRALAICVFSSSLLIACGSQADDSAASIATDVTSAVDESVSPEHFGGYGDVAPPQLVVRGQYSDRRFIDMMAPHHKMAIDMARLALERAEHAELRQMAQKMIDAQTAEIEELRSIKADAFGTSRVPSRMNPEEMENSGVPPMSELESATNFDCAFLEAMLPHHAGAIRMASVARRRSRLAEIREMSRSIVHDQAEEIGQLEAWHKAWCAAESP